MLQQSFPELEQLFMDTAQRREHRRNEVMLLKRSTLNSFSARPKHHPSQMTFHTNPLTERGFFGSDDEAAHAEEGGGHFSDDVGMLEDDFSSQNQNAPLIKLKPVFPKGALATMR